MKKILGLLLFLPFFGYSQGIKVEALPTTTVGVSGDYLIKDKQAGGAGGTQKISVGNFISTYSITTSAAHPVTAVNGTANKITVTGTATPTVTIASTYAGQTSIVTTGTLTTGTWQAGIVQPAYGGTGVNNSTNALTVPQTGTAALATGVTGGQTINGGTGASTDLTLSSTANATKRKILFGTSAYDELNNRLGIGTASPSYRVHVVGTGTTSATRNFYLENALAAPIFSVYDSKQATIGNLTLDATETFAIMAHSADGTTLCESFYNNAGQKQGHITGAGRIQAGHLSNVALTSHYFAVNASNGIYLLKQDGDANVNADYIAELQSVGGAGQFVLLDGSGGVSLNVNGSTSANSYYNNGGNFGFNSGTSPTAKVHIGGGTATAGTGPIKVDAGTLLSTTEAGSIENNGTHLYYTAANGGTRFQLDQQAGAGGIVTSVSGTADRITSTGGTTPVIDISASYVGQTSLTTLGTITTGVWTGSVISSTYGGTGINNGGRTLTINSNNGALTYTAAGTLTIPETGTAALATGVTGGQTIAGGTAASTDLTLTSTAHATKRKILFGTSAYDELNNRLGIGTTSPVVAFTNQSSQLGWTTASDGILWNTSTASAYCFSFNNTAASSGLGLRLNTVGTDAGSYPLVVTSNTSNILFVTRSDGNVGIGQVSPTAFLHLKAGVATANAGAPLKFTSGTNLTTAETGAMEYNGTQLFFTNTGTTRNIVTMTSGTTAMTAAKIPFATTNGFLTSSADFKFASGTITIGGTISQGIISLVNGIGVNSSSTTFTQAASTGKMTIATTSDDAGSNGHIILNPQGNVGINLGASAPSAMLHVISTTEQFRVGYDASNYYNATVGSTGGVTFNAVGSGSEFTFSDLITPSAGIKGTTTNNDATAGNVGEYVSSVIAGGSAITFTTTVTSDVTSISLTAGDWDVEGNVNYGETASTVTARAAGITSTDATIPVDGSQANCGVQSVVTSEKNTITLPRKRFSLSGTTTIYLVANATFSAGTCVGFGTLTARRVR